MKLAYIDALVLKIDKYIILIILKHDLTKLKEI